MGDGSRRMNAETTVELTFGEWLKRRRRGLDLTREKLAGRAGCSAETIKKIESGDLRPSVQLAELLAQQLDIPVPAQAAFVQFARSGTIPESFNFPQQPIAAPAVVSAAAQPKSLPVPVTSLHGRLSEIEAALALLRREDVRLLTLTGPPGSGKTRLALALSTHAQSDFVDGAAFVPLAPISDPLLVVTAVAQALGVQEQTERPLHLTLQNALREKHLLIILDNFEQVMDASLQVSAWLAAARHVKIVVTSREPLHLYGEHILPVPPLELPDVRELPPPEGLLHYSAVELFCARARAVKPAFELTDENANAVAQVCVLLDGLPLAIEMAAAQIRRSTPQRLLSQLNQHLVSLTGGLRDLAPRQQTLRGAIGWSYDLLSPEEQRLFAALGVFAGGSTLDAIEYVVPTAPGDTVETLETNLENLIDKNLLVWEPGDQNRYTMLEMIREYAGETLRVHGEWDRSRRRHAEYYLALAQKTRREAQDARVWRALAPEQDNVRAALRWGFEETDLSLARHLCAEWGTFWLEQGQWSEGLEWIRRALETMEPAGANAEQQRLRATLLERAGELAERQESQATTRQFYQESLRIRRELGEPGALVESLMSLASFSYFAGEQQQGLAYGEEGLALCRAAGDERGTSFFLNQLARLAFARDDYPVARAYVQESLRISRRLGDKTNLALAL